MRRSLLTAVLLISAGVSNAQFYQNIVIKEQDPREKSDYYPTYEQAAERKRLGLGLNHRELKAYREGPRASGPRPGSIEEQLLLRQHNSVLKNETDASGRVIETITDNEIRRNNAAMKTRVNYEKQSPVVQHQIKPRYNEPPGAVSFSFADEKTTQASKRKSAD